MDWAETLTRYLIAASALVVALVASCHAILYKRDTRAAALWVGLMWMVPLLGAILYLLLGINRIERRAAALRGCPPRSHERPSAFPNTAQGARESLPPAVEPLESLARLVGCVVTRPLLAGNRIEPLIDGDAAFPAMLDSIRGARTSVALSTYIFDRDRAGLLFVEALKEAVARGIEVRVLVDAAGVRYSFPSILSSLRRARVRAARFLPTLGPWRLRATNLRNHRKLLVVDGLVAYTGGMNIRIGHCLRESPPHPVQDLQFRVEGPVVGQLQETFADDWCFTTGEALTGEAWFPRLEERGPVVARAIADGPDEDFDKLRLTFQGALSCARRSVRIVTPYFLPDQDLISDLTLATLRGVEIDIVVPSRSNIRVVNWAMSALLWQVLERGCRVWMTPPPFDHSKLMLVDDRWTLLGSGNWDARSLRLNFELNVEAYDAGLASALAAIVARKLERARRLTLDEVNSRSLPVRLRDGAARLFAPFL